MNDEEINRAIAEHLGWIVPDGCANWRTRPDGKMVFFNPLSEQDPIPNYCGDLNACAEFEKTIVDWVCYRIKLSNVLGIGYAPDLDICEDVRAFVSAKPKQRCEAFLRIHNKWKE